jgi:hypothetical protein
VPEEEKRSPQVKPTLPDSLAGWGTFDLSDSVMKVRIAERISDAIIPLTRIIIIIITRGCSPCARRLSLSLQRLAEDKSVLALSRASLPEAELTAAYVELLIRSLQKRGLDVHVLPLFQLLRMIARLAIKDEGMYQVGGDEGMRGLLPPLPSTKRPLPPLTDPLTPH